MSEKKKVYLVYNRAYFMNTFIYLSLNYDPVEKV